MQFYCFPYTLLCSLWAWNDPPLYGSASLPDQVIAAIARHLASCAACNEEYEELVLLAELEERDELLDA